MLTRRRIFFCAFLILAASALALHFYLNSGQLRQSVLAEVTQYYAGRVDLDRVSLRVGGGLILRGMRFHETQEKDSRVICEIPRVNLEGSLWNLWRGHFKPSAVTARKATLRVFQTADGKWEFNPTFLAPDGTSVPGAIPIEISDAALEFVASDGHGTKTIRRIDLILQPSERDESLSLSGNVQDLVWGSWTFSSTIAVDTGEYRGRLDCPVLRLKPQLADWLGTSLGSLWRQLGITGDVAVEATIVGNFKGNTPAQYEVLVDPRNASVSMPLLGEPIRNLAGRIELTRDEVRVHGLAGETANGQIVAAGTLSHSDPQRISLSLELRNIDVQRVVPATIATEELSAILAPLDSISGKFQADGLRDPMSWTGSFDGSLRLQDSQGPHIVPLHMALCDGVLTLQHLEWQWGGGQVSISARSPIYPQGDLEGVARIKQIDLRAAGRTVARHLREFGGTANAELSFRVPLRSFADPHAWQWTGPVRLAKLQVGQLFFDSMQGTLAYQQHALTLSRASAELAQRNFSGNLTVHLIEPHAFSATFRMAPVELSDLERTAVARNADVLLRGTLEVSGKASGRLASDAIQLAGEGVVRRLAVGPLEFADTSFQYELVENGLRLSAVNLAALGGRFRGSGRCIYPSQNLTSSRAQSRVHSPATAFRPCELRLLGSFDNVELSQLLQTLSVPGAGLRGPISGELQLQIDLASGDPSNLLRMHGRAASKRLEIAGVPAFDASGDFELDGNALTMKSLTGNLPAGKVTGHARVDLSKQRPTVAAELQSDGLSLGALDQSTSHRSSLRQLRGTAGGSAFLEFDLATGRLSGQGAGRIQSLEVGSLPVIDSVLVRQFDWRDGKLLVPAFQAALWGGGATGSCEIDLTSTAKFAEIPSIKVDRVELARIASAWPSGASVARGKVSGAGRLTVPGDGVHRAVVGAGEFTIESAAFDRLALGRTAGTIEAFDSGTHEIVAGRVQAKRNVTPRAGEQRVLIRIREAQPAGGSLHGTVLLGYSDQMTYDANLRFNGLDLATVAQAVFASRHAVSGSLSGEMRLVGTDRGTADARGDMWFRVDNGNLWRFPVLAVFVRESTRVFNRLLNLNLAEQSAQTAMARRVTLQNGVLRVHEFWIAGDMGRLFGEGNIALDGRIDLDFVGNFDTGLPKNVPILGQLSGALDFLQQRLVKVHLSGTLSEPVAIPVPLQDLTDPAKNFFRSVITGTLFDDPSRTTRPVVR